jgi:hypothetical protein
LLLQMGQLIHRYDAELLKPVSDDVDSKALFAGEKEHHYYVSHVVGAVHKLNPVVDPHRA